MEKIAKYQLGLKRKLAKWSKENLPGILLFNLIVVTLVLLHTANYFLPYFFISINFIFFIGLILTPLILRVGFRALFFSAIWFWLLSALLKLLNIDAWAERSSIYCFQALFVAILVLLLDTFIFSKRRNVD